MDDLLVYNGTLDQVQRTTTMGILPTVQCASHQPYHTILFSTDNLLAKHERHTVIR